MKVVHWEESEERATENPINFITQPFLSYGPVRRWKRRLVDALVRRMFMSVVLQSWVRTIQILVGRADRKTAEQLRLGQQELRQEEEERQPERKEPAVERNIPIGQPQVKEALIRDLLHRFERQTETRPARSRMSSRRRRLAFDRNIFRTPMGRRRWRHFLRFWDPRGEERRAESCLERGNPKGDGLSRRSTPWTLK